MIRKTKNILCFFVAFLIFLGVDAKDYYVHPKEGNDNNVGTNQELPFRSLKKINLLEIKAGDRIFLAAGHEHRGQIKFSNVFGTVSQPVVLSSYSSSTKKVKAIINAEDYNEGIWIQNSCYINIENIEIVADGYASTQEKSKMKCGLLLLNDKKQSNHHINIRDLYIHNIYFENEGFVRNKNEVKTPNGTQSYGWGIRLINRDTQSKIHDVKIEKCSISNVSHTGIKLTGKLKNIFNVRITKNELFQTGGPGIQMSGVKEVYVGNNKVCQSGNKNDERKWGRGSGLWTWGSSRVLIENNQFLYANGPADSAGAHIDFNCSDIIIQYNLSAHNAGGFCEVLGNNYNCAYRYNISYNDGYRKKGENGAYQEGKILWLSGYRGKNKKRKGPYQTYIYNNTIITDESIAPKIAIDKRSSGILIANNIFCLKNKSQLVKGDQYRPDSDTNTYVKDVFFKNNLFLNSNNWPETIQIMDEKPIFGDPNFKRIEDLKLQSFKPLNQKLVKSKGIAIEKLMNDPRGLYLGIDMKKDILGKVIDGPPSLGAIQ